MRCGAGPWWDAPDIHADSAEFVSLHHRRCESQLRRADGTDISGGSSAHDDYVERIRHESLSVLEKRER